MAGAVEWRNVFSKSASRVGYDPDEEELYVQWVRTGRISIYGPEFPYEEFDKLSKSVSVGNMIREKVIPNYSMRYAD